MKVNIPYTIKAQTVADLLVTAMEGGSHYWCDHLFYADQPQSWDAKFVEAEHAPNSIVEASPWYCATHVDRQDTGKLVPVMELDVYFHVYPDEDPFPENKHLENREFRLHRDDEIPELRKGRAFYIVGRKQIAQAFETMATRFPRHWEDLINDNMDADTADVWLQCCTFNDIIFG